MLAVDIHAAFRPGSVDEPCQPTRPQVSPDSQHNSRTEPTAPIRSFAIPLRQSLILPTLQAVARQRPIDGRDVVAPSYAMTSSRQWLGKAPWTWRHASCSR